MSSHNVEKTVKNSLWRKQCYFCFKDFTFPQNFLWFLDWIEKGGEASIEMPNSKVSVQNIHCTTSCQQISICAENTKAISRYQVKTEIDLKTN